ncbi:hypothetical protein [Roseovarius sp. MBR-6]|jgi:hypothetical protein|uniref:hypothetical protein n=1 Tax=Roseovarius sp. MBR-6 TaxID=3156459 RepID=UPI003398498B
MLSQRITRLFKRIDRLDGTGCGKVERITPVQRDALDRWAAAITSGGEAEATARRGLADSLVDFDP